jgi:hypothetical protein
VFLSFHCIFFSNVYSPFRFIPFSRELFISYALSRHYSWSDGILFVEEFLNNKPCCQKHCQFILPPSDTTESATVSDNEIQKAEEGDSKKLTKDRIEEKEHRPANEEIEKAMTASTNHWKKHHGQHRDIEHTVKRLSLFAFFSLLFLPSLHYIDHFS